MTAPPITRRAAIHCLPALCASSGMGAEPVHVLRFGLSNSLMGDINVNDARSAMAVWFQRIEQDMKVALRYDPNVFEDVERLATRLRQGQLDAVGVNVLEYRRLVEWLDPDEVVVAVQKAVLQYVLLVRSDAGISRLADLKGRRLMTLENPRTCIAPLWLGNLLASEGLGGAGAFFGSIARKAKPTQAVLPVFFGQAEACLTTSASFQTMGELNPQVALKLRPLAISPEMFTTMYAYRRGWKGMGREIVSRAMEDLKSSPGGRQILALFQSDRLVVSPSSCLQSALAIIAQAERNGTDKVVRG